MFLPLTITAQEVTDAMCEYWIDGDFKSRKSVSISESWEATIDLSTLKNGAHTIGLRVCDSNGLWSTPIIKYFVRPTIYAKDGSAAIYEYWIDNYAQKVTGEIQGDELSVEIDASALATGAHTLTLRTQDNNGLWSTPIVRYFVRPTIYAEGAEAVNYEYWIDAYTQKVTGELQGNTLETEIDASALTTGAHTFAVRTQDSNGVWSTPIVKYFIHTGAVEPGTLRSYRYWIDNDIASAVSGETADGIISLECDLAGLSYGVHTITLQAESSNGILSSPICKFFVVAEPALTENNIVAYEYWFNNGKIKHVDVDPANPLVLENLWIDITDVVPHRIPEDYRFDAVQATAWCSDEVFFGLQAFDAADRGTVAILSDTFAMEVPVKLEYIELSNDVTETFEAPQPGYITAFVAHSADGDSIEWSIDGQCTADFYSETGATLAATKISKQNNTVLYRTKAQGESTFVLAYNNQKTDEEQAIRYHRLTTTGIYSQVGAGINIYAEKGILVIEANSRLAVCIYDEQGRTVANESISGTTRYRMQTGVYTVKTDEQNILKVFVP